MPLDDMWVEKYRPKKLSDIIGQEEVTQRLEQYVQTKNLPHLMFSGPPGSGKTASGVALAREMFGDLWTLNFTELNASDERGIDTVRGKIKSFARSSPIGDSEFKIIFLDEADALTDEAQSALRRTMETYTNVCRFILSCNYPTKIIEPIQSRCTVFRFKPISNFTIIDKINQIAKAENVEVSPGALNAIIYIAQGDMRKAINVLQGSAIINKKIDSELIYKASSLAKPEDIRDIVMYGLQGNFAKAKANVDNLLMDGMSPDGLVNQIYRAIFTINISDKMKIDIIDNIGDIDFRLTEGANERIQLDVLIARLALHGINK